MIEADGWNKLWMIFKRRQTSPNVFSLDLGSRDIYNKFTYVSIKNDAWFLNISINWFESGILVLVPTSILQTFLSVHYIPGKHFSPIHKKHACSSSRHRHWCWQRRQMILSPFYDNELIIIGRFNIENCSKTNGLNINLPFHYLLLLERHNLNPNSC